MADDKDASTLSNKEETKNYQASFTATPTYTILPNGQVQMVLNLPSSSLSALPHSYPNLPSFSPQPTFSPFQQHAFQCSAPPQPIQSYQCCSPSIPSLPPSVIKIALLLSYTVGLFTFVPHLFSVILSLHMIRKRQIVRGAATTLAFSVIEIIAWSVCAALSWYNRTDCYLVKADYIYYDRYDHTQVCYNTYYGWIVIAVWFGIAICLGIPRVYLSWNGNGNRNRNRNRNNNSNSNSSEDDDNNDNNDNNNNNSNNREKLLNSAA